jgi:hypothetical protein
MQNIYSGITGASGNSVGLSFEFSGEADATLILANAGAWINKNPLFGPLTFGMEAFWLTPRVFINNIKAQAPGQGALNFAGSVGAHEISHRLLRSGDLLYDSNNLNIMMYNNLPNEAMAYATDQLNSAAWQFTTQQIDDLFAKCKSRRGGGGGGGGVGGGSGHIGYLPIYGLIPYGEGGYGAYAHNLQYGIVGLMPIWVGPRRK